MNKIGMILERLDMVKPSGKNRFMSRCPAHDDKTPSLLITEDAGGKVGVHCFGGCGGADVLAAIGLSFCDLYPDELTRDYSKGLPDWTKRQLEKDLREHKFTVSAAKEWIQKGEKMDNDYKLKVLNSVERIKEITKRLQNNE